MKESGALTVDFLTQLFNKRLETKGMPEELMRCVLVRIFKDKGAVAITEELSR